MVWTACFARYNNHLVEECYAAGIGTLTNYEGEVPAAELEGGLR